MNKQSIHESKERNLNCTQVGRLLYTIALVENAKSFIIVIFTKRFHIKYERSTSFAEICMIDSNGNLVALHPLYISKVIYSIINENRGKQLAELRLNCIYHTYNLLDLQ